MLRASKLVILKLIFGAILFCSGPVLHAEALLHLRDAWYFTSTGDLAWHNGLEFKPAAGGNTDLSYDPGLGVGLSVGKAKCCWRVELEAFFRESDLDNEKGVTSLGTPFDLDATGYIRDFTLMANGYWDFEIPNYCWMAYVGGGLGLSIHERKACTSVSDVEKNSNDTLFAWQVMAGVSYEIIKNVYTSVGYRLVSTTKPSSRNEKADDLVFINNLEFSIRVEL